MAINSAEVALQSIRTGILTNFERQSELLISTRKDHSHSDDLLPPDLVVDVLAEGTSNIKAYIEGEIGKQAEGSQDAIRDIVKRDLLSVECKRFIFEVLSTLSTLDEDEVRHGIRRLFDRFDIVLNLDIEDVIEPTLMMSIHEDILERLPIESCSLHFTYIESRKDLLTKGLLPTKGKGLTLLRICNELLRRLSKPIRQHTVFAGRVLSLLSSVLPSGERSGVNFRGDFNVDNKTTIDDQSKEERKAAEAKAQREADEILAQSHSDPRFYAMFWSAQKWFANPTLLFHALTADQAAEEDDIVLPRNVKDPAPEGSKGPVKNFRIVTRAILNVFAAVGRIEKELSGKSIIEERKRVLDQATADAAQAPDAGHNVSVRQSKKEDAVDPANDDGFFPKYLTGQNLFEYEIRDASFRRHILVQFLILLQFMLGFTTQNKEKMEKYKNKPLLNMLNSSNFTLDETDERWIHEIWKDIISTLNSIPPNGKAYSDAIVLVLTREVNWLRWKAEDCRPIDRASLTKEELQAYTKAFKTFSQPLRPYPHSVGTAALSRLWEDGVSKPEPQIRKMENAEGFEVEVKTDGLDELEMGPRIPSLEQYASQIAQNEQKAKRRREDLGYEQPLHYVLSVSVPAEQRKKEGERIIKEENDSTLADLEQRRSVLAWRAMRMARTTNLGSLGKMRCEMPDGSTTIGPRVDDVTRLMQAISDKENGIPALPTPAPKKEEDETMKVDEKAEQSAEQTVENVAAAEGEEKANEAEGEEKAKEEEGEEATADSPEYEPEENATFPLEGETSLEVTATETADTAMKGEETPKAAVDDQEQASDAQEQDTNTGEQEGEDTKMEE
ncbi:uncharacterized protein FA14DRAFT_121455 [Meira miltonrushii]|uniref:THO complex subunit 1 transcription elongation factor n=1 Tax=Meira miltonrushii TaxID=1280837 RepID=A0A316VEQ1_9BASI|nr:uncharacterized protein FA14DRAFT_121455 [Meira miltonrushii]PWN36099.1 hypothetical protein FA14DRAFT_121455 [Meira miltonrushii]